LTDDPYAVMEEWLANGRGQNDHVLVGTTPARYREDVTGWLDFIEDSTGIGAWNASEAHIQTWADFATHNRRARDRAKGSAHSRMRRLSAVSSFYAYAHHTGRVQAVPFDPVKLRTTDLPRTPALDRRQTSAIAFLAGLHAASGKRHAHRDKLLVYAMLDGFRPRQIVGLSLDSIPLLDNRPPQVRAPFPKGEGVKVYRVSRELEQAVRAYLPHRVPSPTDEPTEPLITSRSGARLDPHVTPSTALRTVLAAGDNYLLPEHITPDQLALSPVPFTDGLPSSLTTVKRRQRAADGTWTDTPAPGDLPLALRMQRDLEETLGANSLLQHLHQGSEQEADCPDCQAYKQRWADWEQRWQSYEPDCWSWPVPPYDPDQHPAERFLEFHQNRCAMCGILPGRAEHHEDHDHATNLVRGLLCAACNNYEGATRSSAAASARTSTQGRDEALWGRYLQRPPTAILGLEVRYPFLRGRRLPRRTT
jgi:site-specific recombinase XerC